MAETAVGRFTTGSPMRHVMVMTATGSVGLIAVFAVDLLNLFYISLLGERELAAAVGFAGTVLFLQSSLCIGLSIGAGALVARAIGGGRRAEAERLAGSSLILTALVAAVVGLLSLPLLGPAMDLLGARGATKDLAVGYLTILSPTLPLLGLGMGCSAMLRAQGDARRAMTVTLYAALFTAALNPVLIFGLRLDLTGAAVTVVLSRCLLAAVGWHGVARVHRLLAAPGWTGLLKDARTLAGIAGPAVLTNLATPVAGVYVTTSMARFGDAAIAGAAIVDRMVPVAFGTIFALTGAVGPILAQNLGAGRLDRVRATLLASLALIVVWVLAVWLGLFLARDWVVIAFSAEGVSADLVRLFCTAVAGGFLFVGFLFVGNAAFNNLGFPLLATGFNWGRATLGTMPFVAVGGWLGGAPGVLIGQAAGSVLFGIAAVWVAFRVTGRLGHKQLGRTGGGPAPEAVVVPADVPLSDKAAAALTVQINRP